MQLYETVVDIYCGSGCHPNPGIGGWAALLRCKDVEKVVSGNVGQATNARMDLVSAVYALESLKRPCLVRLHSSSRYLVNGMAKDQRLARQGSSYAAVPNGDLWRLLDHHARQHAVEWVWVRSGENEFLNRSKKTVEKEILKHNKIIALAGNTMELF